MKSVSETTIVWKKCKKCEKLQNLDHLRCIQCKNTTFDTVKSSGDCKLLTYTILTATPSEYRDKKSYAIGVVEYSNGLKAMGQITTSENLKIGMKLTSKFQKLTENLDGKEIFGITFKPT